MIPTTIAVGLDPNLIIVIEAMIPERLAVPTIDKSMPPDIIAIIIPKHMIPNSGICAIIELIVLPVKKVGEIKAIITTIAIAIRNKVTSLLSVALILFIILFSIVIPP